MATLILHHYEKFWEEQIEKYGTTFEECTHKILDFIENTNIDKVIVTRFEGHQLEDEHDQLFNVCQNECIDIECITYPYGWQRDLSNPDHADELEGFSWCQGTRDHHSENDIIEIEEWQRNLQDEDLVYVAGAFENECVLDLTTALDALNVNYEQVEGLVVGDCYQYEYIGDSPKDLEKEIENEIGNIEQEVSQMFDEYDCSSIDELMKIKPREVMELSNQLNALLIENLDNINKYKLDFYSEYGELHTIIDNVMINQCECEDLYFEAEEYVALAEKTVLDESGDENIYYHGTYWDLNKNDEDIDEICHNSLENTYSGYDVNYVSNSESVAEFFTTWQLGNESIADSNIIPVIFEIKLELRKIFEINVHDEMECRINRRELHLINDREDLFEELRDEYDAVIIKENYPDKDNGDDIALLDDVSESQIERVKLKINNKWTDFMEVDDAKKIIEQKMSIKSDLKNCLENLDIKNKEKEAPEVAKPRKLKR